MTLRSNPSCFTCNNTEQKFSVWSSACGGRLPTKLKDNAPVHLFPWRRCERSDRIYFASLSIRQLMVLQQIPTQALIRRESFAAERGTHHNKIHLPVWNQRGNNQWTGAPRAPTTIDERYMSVQNRALRGALYALQLFGAFVSQCRRQKKCELGQCQWLRKNLAVQCLRQIDPIKTAAICYFVHRNSGLHHHEFLEIDGLFNTCFKQIWTFQGVLP